MILINESIPDTFIKLYSQLKERGGRVHQGVLSDLGVIQAQMKFHTLFQNNEHVKAGLVHYMTTNIEAFIQSAFDNINIPIPSSNVIVSKSTLYYRPLVISILKALHAHIQEYINEDTTTLIESFNVGKPSCRIGLKFVYLHDLHADLLKITKDMISAFVDLLNVISNEKFIQGH